MPRYENDLWREKRENISKSPVETTREMLAEVKKILIQYWNRYWKQKHFLIISFWPNLLYYQNVKTKIRNWLNREKESKRIFCHICWILEYWIHWWWTMLGVRVLSQEGKKLIFFSINFYFSHVLPGPKINVSLTVILFGSVVKFKYWI